ncbi:unnamed protein product [Didymodactylos carnosus]|uniref:Chitin-binding type-4 domain-containing protein n=1 Tax=Didymodactylos carnosus TaxID=1234261 RepID=A0A815JWX6_9BILA|nr:unnamed protein product [Didymodactylos carnosus]CAF1387875.1 unnamed protein product [Didymodactylos carnosus]CAF3847932.1 unnamed protein product [Didymodactylos carnosus]CAF4282684.1 unnamed protein product [Didymodactylos carnosus]
MYCGGGVQWSVHKGKCSICGEAYDKQPKLFEKGGQYYLGKILHKYDQGQEITVNVILSANHKGFFEFRLCPIDGWAGDATQDCLDQHLLTIVNTNGQTRFTDVERYGTNKVIPVLIQLPPGVQCQHCVFQWKYTTGNTWGTNPLTGQSCTGCAIENETFMGCADISIAAKGQVHTVVSTVPPLQTTQTTSTTTLPVTTTKPSVTTTTTRTNPGITTWKPFYDYQKFDAVTYNGLKYICITAHYSLGDWEPPNTPALWQLI